VHARQAGTDPAESKKCIDAVHRALGFWIAHDFKCLNWWYNDIGVPKILGTVALLLGDDLQSPEFTYITTVAMPRSKVGSMTGQNRVWLAGNGVMLAAIAHDSGLLKKAADVIADEIKVTDKEGVQPDWSFHQHGPQQQFGNYGLAFAVEMTKWANVLRGTPYAMSPDKLAIVRGYLLNGQNWVTWHGAMDISSCGRQLVPGSPAKKAGAIRGVFRSMETVDPDHAADYRAYVERNTADHSNDLIGNKFFWRSDYMVQRFADWAFTLKMSSHRVIGGETVNSENLAGLHLADGATFIYRTAHEYDDIFPVWDWRKIPGTTSPQGNSPVGWSGKSAHLATSFVGGASDGQTGCAALDFQRGDLRAKKAWFIAGDTVVCLGADISSTGNDSIVTTIDQCLLAGPVSIQEHSKGAAGASNLLKDTGWIEHAGTRYTSLVPQSIDVIHKQKTGNWHTVFDTPGAPKQNVTKEVLTISIDHGQHPNAAGYAYAITPAAQDADAHILANTATVQAVQIGAQWSAAVFWASGNIDLNGLTVAVDNPCILLSNAGKLTIVDPTEKLKSLQLTIAGKSQTIELPQGGEAGKSVAVQISK
jgi:chondroitin AC lyase